jgi:enterochelin esterase-like enzyme
LRGGHHDGIFADEKYCFAAAIGAAALLVLPLASAQLNPDDTLNFIETPQGNRLDENASCDVIDAARAGPDSKSKTDPYDFPSLCPLGVSSLTEKEASRRLRGRAFSVSADQNIFTVLARPEDPSKPPQICCSIQAPLQQIGKGPVWGGQFRIDHLDQAILAVWSGDHDGEIEFRGPAARKAPKASSRKTILRHYSEHQVTSAQSGVTRTISVYTPPGLQRGHRYGVIYLTDAGAYSFAFVIDKAIRQKRIPPVFLISSDSQAYRMEEYIPNGTARFAEHFHFFTKELPAWAETNFAVSSRPDDRSVAGTSNGADFALAAGAAPGRPFRRVIAMSPAFAPKAPAKCSDTEKMHFHVSGGHYEIGFLRGAALSARVLEAADCPVSFNAYYAGHDTPQWEMALIDALTHKDAGGIE